MKPGCHRLTGRPGGGHESGGGPCALPGPSSPGLTEASPSSALPGRYSGRHLCTRELTSSGPDVSRRSEVKSSK